MWHGSRVGPPFLWRITREPSFVVLCDTGSGVPARILYICFGQEAGATDQRIRCYTVIWPVKVCVSRTGLQPQGVLQ